MGKINFERARCCLKKLYRVFPRERPEAGALSESRVFAQIKIQKPAKP
jgi:hypothetical protein